MRENEPYGQFCTSNGSLMCGFAGYIQRGGTCEEQARTIVTAMATAVAHRGPDDSGVWIDGKAGIALSHQRLSVLELSAAGHQPMISRRFNKWPIVGAEPVV